MWLVPLLLSTMLTPSMSKAVNGVFVVTTDQTFRSKSLSDQCLHHWNCTLSMLPLGEIAHDVKFDIKSPLSDRMVTTAFLNVFSRIEKQPPGWYLVFEDDAITHTSMNYMSPPFPFPDDAYMINIQKNGGFYWCNNPSTLSPLLSHLGAMTHCLGGYGMVGFYISRHGAAQIKQALLAQSRIKVPVDIIIYESFRDHIYQSRSNVPGNVYVSHVALQNNVDHTGIKYRQAVSSSSNRCVQYYRRKMCIDMPHILMHNRIPRTHRYAFHSRFDTSPMNMSQIGVQISI